MKLLSAALALAVCPIGIDAIVPATVLSPNDVQIVAFASDAPDAMAFVTWVELQPGTEIQFTDKGWTCSGFRSGETELKFTAQSTIAAGSVFEYVVGNAEGPGMEWELLSGSFSLTGDGGDQITVYQGTAADPTPIFAFDTTDGWEDCNAVTDSYTSAVPTGLVDGVSAVSFVHSDSFWYRPWYAKSAMLETLKEWMVDRKRFKTTSTSATRLAEYQAPLGGFTMRSGQRGAFGYTEYIPGTGPCIILTGHDGDISPDNIDDRNHGCWNGSTCDWSKNCFPEDSTNCRGVTANDENTQDMARRANDYFEAHTGQTCHLVVNRLARIKLDPNREVNQAAQFDPIATNAYNEFHGFAETARLNIENSHPCGAGLLMDFHGHTHPEARIELGYKLSSSQLRGSDSSVDGLAYTSSIKNMPTHNNELFSEVVRGSTSMGAFFELPTALNASGYLSVPSPMVNAPLDGELYFQGGYNVETHGSQDGGSIDGVQIEFPRYIRAQDFTMQEDMLDAFGAAVLPQMLASHYPAACDVLGNTPVPTPAPTNQPTDAPTRQPTNAPTPWPTDSPVRSGVCSDDGLTSCTEVDTSQCSCANPFRKLLRGKEIGKQHVIPKRQNIRRLPKKTPPPTQPGTPNPTESPTVPPPQTTSPTHGPIDPPTPGPTNSPTLLLCKCNLPTPEPTPNPTANPTLAVTPNPTSAPTTCKGSGSSCADSSVICCNECSGGNPRKSRVCL